MRTLNAHRFKGGRMTAALIAGVLMVATATQAAASPVGSEPPRARHAPPRMQDLTLDRPIRCLVPHFLGTDFTDPLESRYGTPSENLVDGDDFTRVESDYNFDCLMYLPATSRFSAIRISWQDFAFSVAVLAWDCRFYGVGSWALLSSMDQTHWTLLAGREAPLVTREDVVRLSGVGRYLKLEVRMANCPNIGGYTVSVFGEPLGPPAPDAFDDSADTRQAVPVSTTVLANDLHLDQPVVTIDRQPDGGIAVVDGDNIVTFTPEPGFSGTTSYVYRVANANRQSATATVSVHVR